MSDQLIKKLVIYITTIFYNNKNFDNTKVYMYKNKEKIFLVRIVNQVERKKKDITLYKQLILVMWHYSG